MPSTIPAVVKVDSSSMLGIANAIRSKSGTSTSYTPSQMPTAIQNIPTSGGGSSSPYQVPSIAAMEALQNVNDEDICIVYNKSISNLSSSFTASALETFDNITLSTPIDDYYYLEYNTQDELSYLSITVNFYGAELYYYDEDTQTELYVNWESEDGTNYTLNGEIAQIYNINNNTYESSDTVEPMFSNFIKVGSVNFDGIYQYSETDSEWKYLDIRIHSIPNEMFLNNSAYTSEGIIHGTLDKNSIKKYKIYTGTDVPTDEPDENLSVYIKTSMDLEEEEIDVDLLPISISPEIQSSDYTRTKLNSFLGGSSDMYVYDSQYIYQLGPYNYLYKYDMSTDTKTTLATDMNVWDGTTTSDMSWIVLNKWIIQNNIIYGIAREPGSSSNLYDIYLCVISASDGTHHRYLVKSDSNTHSWRIFNTIDDIICYDTSEKKYYKFINSNIVEDPNISNSLLGSYPRYVGTINKNNVIVTINNKLSIVDFYNNSKIETTLNIPTEYNMFYIPDTKDILVYRDSGVYDSYLYKYNVDNNNNISYIGTAMLPIFVVGMAVKLFVGYYNGTIFSDEYEPIPGSQSYSSVLFTYTNIKYNTQLPIELRRNCVLIILGENAVNIIEDVYMSISDIQILTYYGNVTDSIYIYKNGQWNILQ